MRHRLMLCVLSAICVHPLGGQTTSMPRIRHVFTTTDVELSPVDRLTPIAVGPQGHLLFVGTAESTGLRMALIDSTGRLILRLGRTGAGPGEVRSPRPVEVGADQIREAIEPTVVQIVDTIKDTIEETPPELVADIMDQGIVLAGGGALLVGLDRRVAEATQMPVHIADDPLTCVARGTGMVLQELNTGTMDRVLVADTYARPPR